MEYFSPINIAVLLIDLAMAWHVIRNGRSPLWIMGMALASFLNFLALLVLWLAYLAVAIIPDFLNSQGMRRFAGSLAKAADPGRSYREKKRLAERVGSADSKRALAEEYLARGEAREAILLYKSAMEGPLEGEPALLLGLGRAELAAGDAAGAQVNFERLREADPALFNESARLSYARALEIQGKTDQALREYEAVAPVYPGQEARLRLALLLEKRGANDRARQLFEEIVESDRAAPGYVRRREREWVSAARQRLSGS